MGNTGLRPDEAKQLQHRDVAIVEDRDSGQRILEIEVRGKRGVGWCKSMPGAVKPYERLHDRAKPAKKSSDSETAGGMPLQKPKPTDLVFPGHHLRMFNGLLEREGLKLDRDGKARTAGHTGRLLCDRAHSPSQKAPVSLSKNRFFKLLLFSATDRTSSTASANA